MRREGKLAKVLAAGRNVTAQGGGKKIVKVYSLTRSEYVSGDTVDLSISLLGLIELGRAWKNFFLSLIAKFSRYGC